MLTLRVSCSPIAGEATEDGVILTSASACASDKSRPGKAFVKNRVEINNNSIKIFFISYLL